MSMSRRALLLSASAVLAGRRALAAARTVLLHPDGEAPLPLVLVEMARVAGWDVLPVVPSRTAIEAEARRLRSEGDRRIVVAGAGAAGAIALAAATLPGIDAVVALAPAVDAVSTGRLAAAKAGRIAVVLVDDIGEEVLSRLREALGRSSCSCLLVDRPPDLVGLAAVGSGRFVRRFRDDLLWLVQTPGLAPGEVPRPPPFGYAVGAEIDFPAPVAPGRPLPRDAHPALAAFWGRWEGDAEDGSYFIVEATDAARDRLIVRIGVSDGPTRHGRAPRLSPALAFERDGSGRRLYYRSSDSAPLLFVLTALSDEAIEYARLGVRAGWPREYRVRLARRS